VGAWTAAIFHLFTHAFFKALLFLGAGSVSHAVHSFDMKKDMGGLRAHMPVTFATFMIGSIALAGLPPFAGFWSKDEILLGAAENGYRAFEIIGLAGAFMTACYMTRCVYLTFFGEYRGHGHPHESPKPITIPLIVLAGLSMTVGLLQFPGLELFTDWTDNETILTAGVAHHPFEILPAVISTVVVLAGIGLGVALYWGGKLPVGLTERNPLARGGYQFLANKYYLDALYTDGVVASVKGPIARAAYWVNQHVIDAVVNAVGIGFAALGRFVYARIDQGVVDGAVNLSGTTAGASGGLLRTLQTGRVQQYGALLFGAATLLALALVVLT
jgi:NADH-quinone oxidoreductase subunit L